MGFVLWLVCNVIAVAFGLLSNDVINEFQKVIPAFIAPNIFIGLCLGIAVAMVIAIMIGHDKGIRFGIGNFVVFSILAYIFSIVGYFTNGMAQETSAYLAFPGLLFYALLGTLGMYSLVSQEKDESVGMFSAIGNVIIAVILAVVAGLIASNVIAVGNVWAPIINAAIGLLAIGTTFIFQPFQRISEI